MFYTILIARNVILSYNVRKKNIKRAAFVTDIFIYDGGLIILIFITRDTHNTHIVSRMSCFKSIQTTFWNSVCVGIVETHLVTEI